MKESGYRGKSLARMDYWLQKRNLTKVAKTVFIVSQDPLNNHTAKLAFVLKKMVLSSIIIYIN